MAFVAGSFNQFQFRFSKEFIPEEIKQKYDRVLKYVGTTIKDTLTFLNYSIQSIQLDATSASYDPITQIDTHTKWGRQSRSDLTPNALFNKTFTITFKLDSSFLSYFLLKDLFDYYYDFSNKEKFIPQLPGLQIIDAYGNILYRVNFHNVLFTGISGLEFNFTDTTIDTKTFTTNFSANRINMELLDKT